MFINTIVSHTEIIDWHGPKSGFLQYLKKKISYISLGSLGLSFSNCYEF